MADHERGKLHLHTVGPEVRGVWVAGIPADWSDCDVREWVVGLAAGGSAVAGRALEATSASGWITLNGWGYDTLGRRVYPAERVYLDR